MTWALGKSPTSFKTPDVAVLARAIVLSRVKGQVKQMPNSWDFRSWGGRNIKSFSLFYRSQQQSLDKPTDITNVTLESC